jgi:glycosyltransferase involved in cell wall biosynthesis
MKVIEYKLESHVQIIPFINDLSEIWNMTDIAIVPSTEAESFGLVALEAMFAKKPVIATNLGGLKEIVVHNETGFLFQNKNENELKDALEKLISNKDLRTTFGEKGNLRAVNKFSLDEYVQNFINLYKKLRPRQAINKAF